MLVMLLEYEALTHLITCEHIKLTLWDEWFNWMKEKKEKMKEEKERIWAAEFTNGLDSKWCTYVKLLMGGKEDSMKKSSNCKVFSNC